MKLAPFRRHVEVTYPTARVLVVGNHRRGMVLLLDEAESRVAFVSREEVENPQWWPDVRWDPLLPANGS